MHQNIKLCRSRYGQMKLEMHHVLRWSVSFVKQYGVIVILVTAHFGNVISSQIIRSIPSLALDLPPLMLCTIEQSYEYMYSQRFEGNYLCCEKGANLFDLQLKSQTFKTLRSYNVYNVVHEWIVSPNKFVSPLFLLKTQHK